MSASEQRDAFRRELYPILLSGDTSAFRRFLRQWEEVIGDTAELAETSEAQQRKTMDALLRRPQQFNLPPWPRDIPAPAQDRVLELELEEELGPPPALPPAEHAAAIKNGGTGSAGVSPVGEDGQGATPGAMPDLPVPEASLNAGFATEEAQDGSGVYQLDMITGELVPVDATAVRQAHVEPEPATTVPKPRRQRRKRVPSNLAQLVFWREDELAS